jgi:hypothetical protein
LTHAVDPPPVVRFALCHLEQPLVAQAGVVLATQPPSTVVFDARTGRRRFGLPGEARPIGGTGLLLVSEKDQTPRVVSSMDGAAVATPWDAAGRGGIVGVQVLANTDGLAVLRPDGAGGSGSGVTVYAIKDDAIDLVGQAPGLPVIDFFQTDLCLGNTDDGRATLGACAAHLRSANVWPVLTESVPDTLPDDATREGVPASASPRNGFEIERSDDVSTFNVVRRADGARLGPFRGEDTRLQFSGSERWLAVWEPNRLQVLDLVDLKIAMTLNRGRSARARVAEDSRVDHLDRVEFTANDAMLRTSIDNHIMLVPLEDDLIERFATWLVSRELTAEERCRTVGGAECVKRPEAQLASHARAAGRGGR